MSDIKFLDLFSGIGGFRMAMEQAGHECIGYVEWDKFARKSYESIYDTEGEWTAHDITSVSNEDLELLRRRGIDIICGGFPCQAFSVAGKRGGFDDTRGTLFFEIARFAKQIKPRILLLENVKGLLNHKGGETFGTILNTLDELGYDTEWQVLNSKNFGVPQNRERVFIVGHLRGAGRREVFPIRGTNGEVNIPVKIVAHRNGYRRNTQTFAPDGITEALDTGQGGGRGHYTIQSVSTPERVKKCQNGRRFKEDGEPMFTLTAQDRHGIMLTRHEVKRETEISHCLMTRDYKGIGNQEMTGVMVRKVTKQGGDQEPKIIQKGRGNNKGGLHEIAPTLTSNSYQENNYLTDKYRIRKLTPRECWRLQGFPDSAFDKASEVNSDSQLYKQAGNSVTVNVVYEIAKRLS